MRNRWIKRHEIDTKVSKNHIDETSSSERKTAGSQYLCGFPLAVLAKCLQFLVATLWL